MFRNVFFNWIVWRFDRVVNNPPCLPGWGIIYYVSYMLNFLPIIGIGKIVVSKAYRSMQFSRAIPILYPIQNSQYLTSEYKDSTALDNNFSFQGNIFWIAAAVIWIGMTISQKYPRRKPIWKDFFYSLAGIYLFYIGITAALNLPILAQNSIPF